MTLKIIGAGFGRTGTESMKRALEMLGFGPCYHMYEVLPHQDRVAMWRGIGSGDIVPDWDKVFEGYQATVDWPAAFYWHQLADLYPQAKILLTVRSAESWFASMEKTILKVVETSGHETIGGTLIVRRTFNNDLSRENMINTYNRHVAAVQNAFGPDRLLIYELGSGWAPLCAFLGCDVPEEDYPRGNDAQDFHSRAENSDPVMKGG